jgi:hypothetical protein
MANVNLVVCTTAPNLTTTTYSSWCPSANRRVIVVDDVELAAAALEVSVKPEPVDSVRVADMYSLFIALVGVLVVIWGVKQLLRLFTGDMEKD